MSLNKTIDQDYFFGFGGLFPLPLPDSLGVVEGPFGGRGVGFGAGLLFMYEELRLSVIMHGKYVRF